LTQVLAAVESLRLAGADQLCELVPPSLAGRADPAAASAAIALLVERTSQDNGIWRFLGTAGLLVRWQVRLGALDAAFAIMDRMVEAWRRSGYLSSMNLNQLWWAEMRPFREDPRFQDLVEQLGLMSFWKTHGPPDGHRPEGGKADRSLTKKRATPQGSRPSFRSASACAAGESLLKHYGRAAGFLDLLLDLFGFGLADAFLDGLRRAFDQRLGFAEARPVIARTSLMTLIFLPPSPVRITSNSVCSSAAGAAAPPPPAGRQPQPRPRRKRPNALRAPWRARPPAGRSVRKAGQPGIECLP
jgi:hypothetical protein